MNGPIDPHTVWLADRRLWQNFDGDRWIMQDERNPYAGDEMTAEILRILNQPVRDTSAAQRRIRSLLASGFLKVRTLDDGRLEFTKVGVCPEPPAPVDSAEQMNNELRQGQAVEQARRDREYELYEQAQAVLDGPRLAAERSDFAYRLNEAGLSESKVREMVREEIERAFERHLGAVTTSADIGSAE